ncbi:D-alanine--D-alanine ligase [Candidatus Dependentiae bacterium]|nr:D-alanine--D-alanine ligase [Candidatus Dependentiae bacterium]
MNEILNNEERVDIESATVLVIYCGFSSEYKVSEKTGTAVINALNTKNIKVIPFRLSRENISDIAKQKFDVAFIALHGRYGEDGTVQGYLELLGKKYCGSGVMSSSLCLNKYYTKLIFLQKNIPTPDFSLFNDINEINLYELELPAVIKPIDEGSSIGLSIVKDRNLLKNAVEEAFKHSKKVMIEKYIPGREVTVAVIEKGGNIMALPVIEIAPHNDFFDYEAKYTKGKTDYIVPARIDSVLTEKIKKIGEECFKSLECKDFARIDMIIDKEGKVTVLEINTIPGMTETSLLPKAARAAGIEFEDLIKTFIKNNL